MAGESTLFGGEIHCPNAPTAYNAGTSRNCHNRTQFKTPASFRRKALAVTSQGTRCGGFFVGQEAR